MEEWKECRLKDICDYGKGRTEVSSLDNSTYISTENMLPNRAGITTATTLPTGEYTPSFEIDDALVSNIRPYFKKIWKATFSGGCSADVLVFKAKENVSKEYLYYILADDEFFKYSMTTSKGTKMPHGDKTSIMNYPIKLPPLSTQQKIAAILSSLDDKIELNNKINTNLEQQAQTLFKNWFVDFEPFGGKMLEGWKVGKLCDIADYSSEKIEINKLSPETYYSTENMLPSKGGIETATSLPSISQTTRCLPGETIISNIRPYFKKIFYCTEEVAGCSTDVLCFKPKYKYYSEYLYQVLYSDIFFDYMVLGSKGTKMPRGDKQQIMNYPITIPNELYLRKFKTFAEPIFSQIDLNRKENKRLSELRDTLLPKLMNGEIEV